MNTEITSREIQGSSNMLIGEGYDLKNPQNNEENLHKI